MFRKQTRSYRSMNFAVPRPGALAVLIGLVALVFSPIGAHAQAKDAGNASDVLNPHSPRYEHLYRHGAHPTREQHSKMREWEFADHPRHVSPKAGTTAGATGAQTLSFNGGVDGV